MHMQRAAWVLATVFLCAAAAPRSAQAQMWADADYLFWNRVNTSDTDFISGVGAQDSGSLDFKYRSGYRFFLGSGLGNYEIEASFLRIDDWDADQAGVIANNLALDDTRLNAVVFTGGPASVLSFGNSIFNAASGINGDDETTEAEFLTPGSLTLMTYDSSLRDVQVNFGSNRDLTWWRWGVGYRGIKVGESSRFGVQGVFDALDVDDAEGPTGPGIGVNDLNDGLSAAALAAAGFESVAGIDDGFDAIQAGGEFDTLTMVYGGSAVNRLNGVQLTGAIRGSPIDEVVFETFLRLGLYHNHIDGSANEILGGGGDDDSVYLRSFTAEKDKASFGGNLGVRVLLNVTDYISLTGGYEVLVLSGIALGPDQIGRIQTNVLGATSYDLDATGVFLAHGGSVGLEVRW